MSEKKTELHTIDFSQFTPENLRPLFEKHRDEVRKQLAEIIAIENPTLEDFYGEKAYDETLDSELHWDAIDHIKSTLSTPEYNDAYNALNEDRTRLAIEVSLNQDLYKQYVKLKDNPDFANYPDEIKRDIELSLLNYRLNGIHLEGETKKEFEENAVKLSELQSKFGDNLLAARKHWSKLYTAEELDGLPPTGFELLEAQAKEEGYESGYLVTTSPPVIALVMANVKSRAVRKELYDAYAYLASPDDTSGGQFDNTEVVQKIYEIKQRQAELLGFKNHAERSLATKMAETPEQVLTFLKDLRAKSLPKAKETLRLIADFAKETDGVEHLELWDIQYYTTQYIKKVYEVDPEVVRTYFPEDQVIKGLFAIVGRLYNLTFEEATEVKTYHPDVKFIRIYEDGKLIAGLYLDIYTRNTKRSGAWMNQAFGRNETATRVKLPVAYVVGNFTPPVNGKPALLTFGEVETLFHEMGHALHLILTKVKVQSLCGTNVEWDAVELPSQIHENWCYEPEALKLISRNVNTGEPLPVELVERLRQLGKFTNGGLFLMNQCEYGIFDMTLYSKDDARTVHEVLTDVRKETTDLIYGPRKVWFANTFGHIFGGGYSAGYYSYLWAEVLSADAFAAYKEAGDVFSPTVATAFKEQILAKGGTRPTMDSYVAFRGRKPANEALLTHYGILEEK